MVIVTLNPDQERFAAEAIAKGRFRDLSDVIQAGVDLLRHVEQQRGNLLASVVAAGNEAERDGLHDLDEVESRVSAVIARSSPSPE
jgi:putative addiction module CopG family antidote